MWCKLESTIVTSGHEASGESRLVRCGECKKRFTTFWRKRKGGWAELLPAHKEPKSGRKNSSRVETRHPRRRDACGHLR